MANRATSRVTNGMANRTANGMANGAFDVSEVAITAGCTPGGTLSPCPTPVLAAIVELGPNANFEIAVRNNHEEGTTEIRQAWLVLTRIDGSDRIPRSPLAIVLSDTDFASFFWAEQRGAVLEGPGETRNLWRPETLRAATDDWELRGERFQTTTGGVYTMQAMLRFQVPPSADVSLIVYVDNRPVMTTTGCSPPSEEFEFCPTPSLGRVVAVPRNSVVEVAVQTGAEVTVDVLGVQIVLVKIAHLSEGEEQVTRSNRSRMLRSGTLRSGRLRSRRFTYG